MQKVLKPIQAVIDFDRLESSFHRAYAEEMPRTSREWWLTYYAKRLNEIAERAGIEPEDLLLEWMRWRTSLKG